MYVQNLHFVLPRLSCLFFEKGEKNFGTRFFVVEIFFNGKVMRIMGRCKEEIAGEKKKCLEKIK
ncbi:hypothetical protein EG350_06735 [Chryseobacterium shandongense]|nr:hypothetical protein EG350_06735 [Chryseobacterium shandongense]